MDARLQMARTFENFFFLSDTSTLLPRRTAALQFHHGEAAKKTQQSFKLSAANTTRPSLSTTPRMRMKLLLLLSLVGTALAFRPSASAIRGRPLVQKGSTPRVVLIAKPRQALLQYSLELTALWSSPNGSDEGDKIVILTGSEDGEFPEEMMQSIEDGKPSEWMVMKQVCTVRIYCWPQIESIRIYSHVPNSFLYNS